MRSGKAGMGKSLYKTRLAERLLERYAVGVHEDFPLSITIPLSQKHIQMSEVSNRIIECTLPNGVLYPRLFHIDIAYGVKHLLNHFIEPKYSFFINYFLSDTLCHKNFISFNNG